MAAEIAAALGERETDRVLHGLTRLRLYQQSACGAHNTQRHHHHQSATHPALFSHTELTETDSGTESDPLLTPELSPSLGAGSHHTQTHVHSQLTCRCNPIYSQDRRPVRDHHHLTVPMVTTLSWQHAVTPCLPVSALPVQLAARVRTTDRMLSLDSIECDDYNSEDELASINCFADIDASDDDDDVEVMNYTNDVIGSQCKLGEDACNERGSQCQSMVDEGFQDEDPSPPPLKFCSNPPQGLFRAYNTLSPQLFWACARAGCVADSATQWPATNSGSDFR